VNGVAEVNSLGGEVRAFEIIPRADDLVKYGLGLDEIQEALEKNNRNAGGDRINRGEQNLLVRTVGNLKNIEDITNVTITTRNGTPVLVGNVADVRISSMTRYGGVTYDAKGEAVTGLVLLRKGRQWPFYSRWC
jgi:cobalt-zinc-cadmium resistance protein CzcA